MELSPGNAQALGSREEQQDSFGFSDFGATDFVAHAGILAVLADGMGGMQGGAEASRIAVSTFLSEYTKKEPDESIPDALRRALSNSNESVCEAADAMGLGSEMGTTLVAAVVCEDHLYWVSSGDSRLYIQRRGKLKQLTHDHDYGAQLDELHRQGKIGEEERASHSDRDALTSFLGLPELTLIDQHPRPVKLHHGDRLMLCSDGLYRSLSSEEIAARLGASPQEAAEALVEGAIAKDLPHQDNTTVMVVGCEDSEAGLSNRSKWLAGVGALLLLLALALFATQGPSSTADPAAESAGASEEATEASGAAGETEASEDAPADATDEPGGEGPGRSPERPPDMVPTGGAPTETP